MSEVAGAVAWLLAAVLGWAAVAKLRRPGVTVAAFRALGAPAPRLTAPAVSAVELVAAALLVVRPRAGAALTVVVLAAFTAFLAARLRRGVAAPCACFGGSSLRPVNAAALVRNGLLAAAALLAAAVPAAAPTLPAVVAVGAGAAGAAIVVALADLAAVTGRLWDNRVQADGQRGGAAEVAP